jgi:methionyl-tRNA synthetase
LAKQDRQKELDEALWTSAEALRIATVLLGPVIPKSAEEILDRLGAPVRRVDDLRLDQDGTVITTGERTIERRPALWPRLEAPAEAPVTTKEMGVSENVNEPVTIAPSGPPAAAAAPAAAPGTARISMDQFLAVDLRAALVVAAEKVPNSRKLIKLEVDLGTERRTLVAGLAEAYTAESLVGRTVAVVANLQPAKLMGIESNGMVLAASPEGGRPVLVSFDPPPPPGTRIR